MVTVIKTGWLYHRYQGQTNTQSCYVELDCSARKLWADYNGEIGNAVPVDVWHGHNQRWPIPALRNTASDELLEQLIPLAEIVCDGYSSEWDGNNHVARFSNAARNAIWQIEETCNASFQDTDNQLVVWPAADWLAGLGNRAQQASYLTINTNTTDEELACAAKLLEEKAGDEEIDEVEGLENYLLELRDHMRDLESDDETL